MSAPLLSVKLRAARTSIALPLLLAGAQATAQQPGTVDALNANIAGKPDYAYVSAIVVQPDGKLIIGGNFASVHGVARRNVARLNPDGSLDEGFDPAPNSGVKSVAVQADGKILVGGGFNFFQPNGAKDRMERQYLARLNADGSLDAGFHPRPGGPVPSVSSVVVQADGKILLGGWFTTLQPDGARAPTERKNIARVNADGSVDAGFDPNANLNVMCITVQPNGKILIGGQFFMLQPNGAASPTSRHRIARLNADGSLDNGFNPKPENWVCDVVVQADGKILLGGTFRTLQPNGATAATARTGIARVNSDGSLDTGFDPIRMPR